MTVEESEALDVLGRGGHRDLLKRGHRITKAEKGYVQIPGPMCELAFGNDGYTLGDATMIHIKPVWRRCDQKTSLPDMRVTLLLAAVLAVSAEEQGEVDRDCDRHFPSRKLALV